MDAKTGRPATRPPPLRPSRGVGYPSSRALGNAQSGCRSYPGQSWMGPRGEEVPQLILGVRGCYGGRSPALEPGRPRFRLQTPGRVCTQAQEPPCPRPTRRRNLMPRDSSRRACRRRLARAHAVDSAPKAPLVIAQSAQHSNGGRHEQPRSASRVKTRPASTSDSLSRDPRVPVGGCLCRHCRSKCEAGTVRSDEPPAGCGCLGRCRGAGCDPARSQRQQDDAPHGRSCRPRHAEEDRARRPLPHREPDEDIRRSRGPATRRRGQAAPQR